MPLRLKLERDVRDPCVAWAKDHGWRHKRMHFGRGAARGWPDDYFYKDGVSVWVEFKRPGKALEPLQRLRHRDMRLGGLHPWVTDDITHFKAILRREHWNHFNPNEQL